MSPTARGRPSRFPEGASRVGGDDDEFDVKCRVSITVAFRRRAASFTV